MADVVVVSPPSSEEHTPLPPSAEAESVEVTSNAMMKDRMQKFNNNKILSTSLHNECTTTTTSATAGTPSMFSPYQPKRSNSLRHFVPSTPVGGSSKKKVAGAGAGAGATAVVTPTPQRSNSLRHARDRYSMASGGTGVPITPVATAQKKIMSSIVCPQTTGGRLGMTMNKISGDPSSLPSVPMTPSAGRRALSNSLKDRIAAYSRNSNNNDPLSSSVHTATDIIMRKNYEEEERRSGINNISMLTGDAMKQRSQSFRHINNTNNRNSSGSKSPVPGSTTRPPPPPPPLPPSTPQSHYQTKRRTFNSYNHCNNIECLVAAPMTTGQVGGKVKLSSSSAMTMGANCFVSPPLTTIGGKKKPTRNSSLRDRIAMFQRSSTTKEANNNNLLSLSSSSDHIPSSSYHGQTSASTSSSGRSDFPRQQSESALNVSGGGADNNTEMLKPPRKLDIHWPPKSKNKGKKKQRSMIELSTMDKNVVKSRRISFEPSSQFLVSATTSDKKKQQGQRQRQWKSFHEQRHRTSLEGTATSFSKETSSSSAKNAASSTSAERRTNICINYTGPQSNCYTVGGISQCLESMGCDSLHDFHPDMLSAGDDTEFLQRLKSTNNSTPIRNDSNWYVKNRNRRPDIWMTQSSPSSSSPSSPKKCSSGGDDNGTSKPSWRVKRVWNVEQWDEKEVEHSVEHDDLMTKVKSLLGANTTSEADDDRNWTAQWIYDEGGQIIEDEEYEDTAFNSTHVLTDEELTNAVDGTWMFGQGDDDVDDSSEDDDAARFTPINKSDIVLPEIDEDGTPLNAQWIYGTGDESHHDGNELGAWGTPTNVIRDGDSSPSKECANDDGNGPINAQWTYGNGDESNSNEDDANGWGESTSDAQVPSDKPMDANWTYGNGDEEDLDKSNSKSWGKHDTGNEGLQPSPDSPSKGQWVYGDGHGTEEDSDSGNEWGEQSDDREEINAQWTYSVGDGDEFADDSNDPCKFQPSADDNQASKDDETRPRNRRTYKIKKTLDALPDESDGNQASKDDEARPRNRRTYKIKKTLDALPDESVHSVVTEGTEDSTEQEDSSSKLDVKVPDEQVADVTVNPGDARKNETNEDPAPSKEKTTPSDAIMASSISDDTPVEAPPLASIPAPVFDKSLKLKKKKKKETTKSRCSMMDLLDQPKQYKMVFQYDY